MKTKGELLTPNGEAGGGGDPAAVVQTPPDSGQTQPERIIDDPLLSVLADDLKDLLKVEKGQEPPPEIRKVDDNPPPSPAPAPAAAAPSAEPPKQEPVRGVVKRREDPAKIAERVFEEKMAKLKAAPDPVLPPAAQPAAQTQVEPSDDLSQEQLDELADAEFAEKAEPEKFKGMKDKLKSFYKEVDAWVEKRKDDPDRTFDENDDEFRKFIEEKKPSWNGKRESIRIERIADARAEQKLKEREKETERRLAETQREAREAKFTPDIKRKVESVVSEYDTETKTDDPLEQEVFSDYKAGFTQLSEDYLRVVNGIDQISESNPPELKQRHQWLLNFVVQNAEARAKAKPEETMRDGRRFVTPAQYLQMRRNNEDVNKVYTFTPDDVVGLLKKTAIQMAKDTIKAEEERAQKRGFAKVRSNSGTKPAQNPQPMNPPRATATPAPGPVEMADNKDVEHPGKEVIETLGLDI